MHTPHPIPDPDLRAQHALAPLVESAAALVTDDDSIRLAEQFARQFRWDPWSAQLGTVEWYRDQVMGAVCTDDRAKLLRLMTIHECVRHHQEALPNPRALAPDLLRDFGRPDVPDAETNRTRRTALMGSLPGRMDAPPLSCEEQDAEELANFLNGGRVPWYISFAAGAVCTLLALALFARLA